MAERHTSLPTLYDAPDGVVEGLRAIDPAMELVYWGDGLWWLGRVVPTAYARREEAWQALHDEERLKTMPPDEYRRLLLQRDGFGFVHAVPTRRLDSGLVESYRHMDWMWRYHRDKVWDATLKATNGETKKVARDAKMQDWAQTEGRFVFRSVMRGRRFFT